MKSIFKGSTEECLAHLMGGVEINVQRERKNKLANSLESVVPRFIVGFAEKTKPGSVSR